MKEKKPLNRRRPKKPDSSPANSCNWKLLREGKTGGRRSSAAAFNRHSSGDESSSRSRNPRRRSLGAGNSSELLLMMGSPASSLSFATAEESFSIMSDDGKRSGEGAEEVAQRFDECCSDGSSNYLCSEYECSSVDIIVDAPVKLNPMAETRNKDEADKLMAWKEAKTIKLMNKLKKEEASIDAWERKAAAQAKMEMKKLEAKLEMKREKAMEKMQRKIKVTKKKAEEMKVRERKAASRQITKVMAAFEKMTLTGKTPWRLLFL